jgi:hypothetical protein
MTAKRGSVSTRTDKVSGEPPPRSTPTSTSEGQRISTTASAAPGSASVAPRAAAIAAISASAKGKDEKTAKLLARKGFVGLFAKSYDDRLPSDRVQATAEACAGKT